MISNKLYVMGLNMSGKGLLTQLIDGHKKIAVFPYHKFGISHVLKNFKKTLKSEKHYLSQIKILFFRLILKT